MWPALPAQRLVVGAAICRPGNTSARPVPGQELHHHRIALGGDARGAGAVPHRPGAAPGRRPQPLPYLLDAQDQAAGAFDIELEVLLQSAAMREQGLPPQRLALSNTRHMYWTVAQMVAHHSVGGCKLQPGDLFGSGTLSGPEPEQFGSLLESSFGGKQALTLSSGETRTFLEDGDEVILRARCRREGQPSIGFGECRGVLLPARSA